MGQALLSIAIAGALLGSGNALAQPQGNVIAVGLDFKIGQRGGAGGQEIFRLHGGRERASDQ